MEGLRGLRLVLGQVARSRALFTLGQDLLAARESITSRRCCCQLSLGDCGWIALGPVLRGWH